MTHQHIFRAILGIGLLGAAIHAARKHGNIEPLKCYHAGPVVLGCIIEALLIWGAGGWGV